MEKRTGTGDQVDRPDEAVGGRADSDALRGDALPRNEDRRTIDIDDPVELARWATALDTSEARLRDAVRKVGNIAGRVRINLREGA